MPESPMSATPYEVLGVPSSASAEELRRAYRRRLREAHPDTGGSEARFHAVQLAWERIGTPELRAAYDRGSGAAGAAGATMSRADASGGQSTSAWAAPSSGGASAPGRRDSRPKARSYGHPGGWRRERFLTLMREWVGRGVPLENPYDPALVRTAPREIRHILADAIAEEATATALAELGIGFTIWHDVATGEPDQKIDHIVLGPSGLFAILSEDYGEPVRVRRGELIGDPIGASKPMHSLALGARSVARSLKVKFTGLLIVLPDDALDLPFQVIGSSRGASTGVVQQSHLPALLRNGLPDSRRTGGTEAFDVRTRLQNGIRFV
ncbi:hypothetical protein GCM10027416_27410 [Okibacterium endophyticum]